MTHRKGVGWRAAGVVVATLALVTMPSTAAVGGAARPTESRQLTARSWTWPVAPPWRVTRAFEAPATRFSAGHRGVDLVASPGDPVLAPADGVVSFVGRVVDRRVVSLAHAGDLLSSFEPIESSLVDGQEIRRGEPIGILGAGGHCDGACLHFGVRLHGEYVSPLLYLGGVPRAVLLPLRRGQARGWALR
jgi:murein DD-endopeptidase MepM/ murein hydrolase activator NlpD